MAVGRQPAVRVVGRPARPDDLPGSQEGTRRLCCATQRELITDADIEHMLAAI